MAVLSEWLFLAFGMDDRSLLLLLSLTGQSFQRRWRSASLSLAHWLQPSRPCSEHVLPAAVPPASAQQPAKQHLCLLQMPVCNQHVFSLACRWEEVEHANFSEQTYSSTQVLRILYSTKLADWADKEFSTVQTVLITCGHHRHSCLAAQPLSSEAPSNVAASLKIMQVLRHTGIYSQRPPRYSPTSKTTTPPHAAYQELSQHRLTTLNRKSYQLVLAEVESQTLLQRLGTSLCHSTPRK